MLKKKEEDLKEKEMLLDVRELEMKNKENDLNDKEQLMNELMNNFQQ